MHDNHNKLIFFEKKNWKFWQFIKQNFDALTEHIIALECFHTLD